VPDDPGIRNFAVVQIIVLLIGTTMIVTNLLVDISYGFIDPRIRDARKTQARGVAT
jgi:peptide/nickel transport system permease protein